MIAANSMRMQPANGSRERGIITLMWLLGEGLFPRLNLTMQSTSQCLGSGKTRMMAVRLVLTLYPSLSPGEGRTVLRGALTCACMRDMGDILVSCDAPQSLCSDRNICNTTVVVWPENIYMSEVAPHVCIGRQRGMGIERCSSAGLMDRQQELMDKK